MSASDVAERHQARTEPTKHYLGTLNHSGTTNVCTRVKQMQSAPN